MAANVLNLEDVDFEGEVLAAKEAVLVDFWAAWCEPCKLLAPVLDDLAAEYGTALKVCKINVEACPVTAARYGVRGLPTLILFRNGDIRERLIGPATKSRLANLIDNEVQV